MSTVEQEIISRLHQLNSDEQHKVLEFIEGLREQPQQHYSTRDLMKLPEAECERLVAQAFERAANEDFETFEA
jgi:hypothetical protein